MPSKEFAEHASAKSLREAKDCLGRMNGEMLGKLRSQGVQVFSAKVGKADSCQCHVTFCIMCKCKCRKHSRYSLDDRAGHCTRPPVT